MHFIEIIFCMWINPPKFSLWLSIPFLLDKNVFSWFHHYGNAISVKWQLKKFFFHLFIFEKCSWKVQDKRNRWVVFYHMVLLRNADSMRFLTFVSVLQDWSPTQFKLKSQSLHISVIKLSFVRNCTIVSWSLYPTIYLKC